MPTDPPVEELNRLFLEWTRGQSQAEGLPAETDHQFELANPSWMAARGLYRYWHKVLHPD